MTRNAFRYLRLVWSTFIDHRGGTDKLVNPGTREAHEMARMFYSSPPNKRRKRLVAAARREIFT